MGAGAGAGAGAGLVSSVFLFSQWKYFSKDLSEQSLTKISHPKCGCGMRNSYHILGSGACAGADKSE